ncbi:unnamed protein product [Ectocarpus sp. CCAP 1310/34]|nr:unnamed protein product [Ectocarpus sp. CCAP 1310/34]
MLLFQSSGRLRLTVLIAIIVPLFCCAAIAPSEVRRFMFRAALISFLSTEPESLK